MNIEHVTDRNEHQSENGVTQMIDLQQALVADHIANLEDEGRALRAERERDHLRDHAIAGTEAADHRADLPSRRVRLGRWLVAVGEALGGTPRPAVLDHGAVQASSFAQRDDPCDEGSDRLAAAA